MATVFEAEALAQMQYPEQGAQERASELIMAGLGELALRGLALSALVYGSSLRGAGIRSDVDVIVRFGREPTEEELNAVGFLRSQVAAVTKVPIDCRIVTEPEVQLSRGVLVGDALFIEHLEIALEQGAPRIGRPLEGLRSITSYPYEERSLIAANIVMSYLVHKSDKFAKALESDEVDLHNMQRALEFPISLWRKVGRLLQLGDYIEGDVTSLLDKKEIAAQLARFNRDDGRWNAATKLMRLNAQYDEALALTMRGEMTVDEYEQWLVDHYEQALRLALKLAWAGRSLVVNWFLPDELELSS